MKEINLSQASNHHHMHRKTGSAKSDLQRRFKNYNFADAKPVKDVPALRKLQAAQGKEPSRSGESFAPLSATRAESYAKKTIVGSVSHRECEVVELRADRELAVEYAKVAMESLNESEDCAAGLLMLRTIAEAYGGLDVIAKEAGISHEALYRALSPKGNPKLTTLLALLKAVGLRLSVEAGPRVAA